MALHIDYPTYCNLFINRLDYDYTRYHLDGIAQYWVGGYTQGIDSCKKAIEYHEKLIEPIQLNIQNSITEYVNEMLTHRPKHIEYIMNCIHLAQNGNVDNVKKLFKKPDKLVSELVSELNNIKHSKCLPEYITVAQQGNIKQVIEYCNVMLTNIKDETSENQQLLFNCYKQLVDITIYSLYEILYKDFEHVDTFNNLLTNIAKESAIYSSHDIKLQCDLRNLKFYHDKLAEIKLQSEQKVVHPEQKTDNIVVPNLEQKVENVVVVPNVEQKSEQKVVVSGTNFTQSKKKKKKTKK